MKNRNSVWIAEFNNKKECYLMRGIAIICKTKTLELAKILQAVLTK